ncbi:MAG: methyltransferase domain-containing protein [Rhizobiales bacterium]|nr:methyltransferase domain-containing protein [Hyphomicrobiales bacterium]
MPTMTPVTSLKASGRNHVVSGISGRDLLGEVWRGKSMTRSLMNSRLKIEPWLSGTTIDFGGGGTPSYLEILKVTGMFVNMDRIEEARPTVVGDLESYYPVASNAADNVILFNTLEHVYRYQHVVDEMCRVLRPNGKALVYVPFIFPIHTHQTEAFLVDDFFRYSARSLDRIFRDAGFSRISIEPLGGLFIVICEFIGFALRYQILQFLAQALCIGVQRLVERLRPNTSAQRYPLGYFIVAQK